MRPGGLFAQRTSTESLARLGGRSKGLVVGAGLLVLVLSSSGCAAMARNAKATDYCTQYHQMVSQADAFRQQDLSTATPQELRAQAARFQLQLQRLVATSDGRLNTGYSDLQTSLDNFRQSIVSTNGQAEQVAQKMLSNSFDAVRKNWVLLQDTIKATCA
jgi:hypothetical protein